MNQKGRKGPLRFFQPSGYVFLFFIFPRFQRGEGADNMKRNLLIASVSALVLFSVLPVASFGAEPIVKNGDFEETVTIPEKDSIFKLASNINFKLETPLVMPASWTLNLVGSAKDGEFRLIQDKSQSQSGNNCVFIRGHLMYPVKVDVKEGDEIDITFFSRSQEKTDISFFLYCYTKNEQGAAKNIGSLTFTAKSDKDWMKHTGKIKIPAEVTGKKLNSVIVALTSRKGSYIDNVEVMHVKAE